MVRTIVLDDDGVFRKALSGALAARGFDVFSTGEGREALSEASKRRFDAAIVDMKMPGTDGLAVLSRMREISPSTAVVMLTGYGSIRDAVEAIKLGGFHYLTKPCDIDEVVEVLKRAVLENGFRASEKGDDGYEEYQGIICASPCVKNVIRLIKKIKDSDLPVLICGESGTGKELAARALHFDSIRRSAPFIAVNCPTLKPELLENELFGHVKGAFTGAVDFKEGLVKSADGGTFFIDEIADMNPAVQASLLRFIETGTFRAVGSGREVRVRTRIVAAINRDIEKEIEAKRFRHDLYYRLNVCRIEMPPLRERPEDIPVLARHFLSRGPGSRLVLSDGAMECLSSHHWPGNVRELCHVLQRAVIFMDSDESVITRRAVEQAMRHGNGIPAFRTQPTKSSLVETEKTHIIKSLNAHSWNISRTATVLGIDRRTLQRKISRYRISR